MCIDALWQVAYMPIGLAILVYMCLASSGYETFGSLVQSNILSNYPSSSVTPALPSLPHIHPH